MKVLCLKKNDGLFNEIFRNSKEILHSKHDAPDFAKVIKKTEATLIEEDDKKPSKIIDAFNYFVKNLDPSKLDPNSIMRHVQFVLIELDKEDDEQQIFDTLNSLEISLTTSELLKNYFFNRENPEEYEKFWASVFESETTREYWNSEVGVGSAKRALIDVFFDAFFQILIQNRNLNIKTEDRIQYERTDRLALSFQHFIKTYCHGDRAEILNKLPLFAKTFMNIFQPDQCNRSVPSEYGLERLNVIIFGLRNTTVIPYILFVEITLTDSQEKREIYRVLESYIMSRMVVRESNKGFNKMFASFIGNRILDSVKLLDILKAPEYKQNNALPSKESLRKGFHESKLVNLQAKGILYLIETALRPKNSSLLLLGFNKYSLEHLMPKNWIKNWNNSLTEEEQRVRSYTLLTLGNLAIIPQSLNSSIRDAAWTKKKKGNGASKPGLNLCANGLITMQEVLNKDTWNETEIIKRSDWLFKKAEKLWCL